MIFVDHSGPVTKFRPGVPFRETHHIAGRVVALAETEGKSMDELTVEQLQGVDKRFGEDVRDVFNYKRSVEMKSASGGTSRSAVEEQIKILKDLTKGLGEA